ncbi:hypothetical protein B0H21DRAFT_700102 [Amylocystis lapponica]|nr:hypothetical protein B0H21DRAFT_700102 [Amylocystis lapponica]
MLVVDLMHEFELGVWKAVFAHLVRILESINPDVVLELNRRFREIPVFGRSTIRRFASNVSEMKKMAARDFEDILQCCIPCIEGLIPTPYGAQILDLIYSLASWHALAKLRMHTESSRQLLDQWTTIIGRDLRHFQEVVCEAFNTRETDRECAARNRAEARRKAAGGATEPGPQSRGVGRQPRKFNLLRIKVHLLGYYASSVKEHGSTDSYSTQTVRALIVL